MDRLQKLFRKLRNKTYRDAFVGARVAAALGAQIAALRRKKDWTQEQLAERAAMGQARISLIEKGDYEAFSFSTLRRLASAFEVAVRIDFVSFTDFLKWSESFNAESVRPDSFSESERKLQATAFVVPDEVSAQLSPKTKGEINAALQHALMGALGTRVVGEKTQPRQGFAATGPQNGARRSFVLPSVGNE